MQLFHCLRWGGIRQTPASMGDGARLPWRMRVRPGLLWKEGSADEMVRGTARRAERAGGAFRLREKPDGPLLGGARRKRRDREHCGGVPVSKRIRERNPGASPWFCAPRTRWQYGSSWRRFNWRWDGWPQQALGSGCSGS
jgi:hypothetical protein